MVLDLFKIFPLRLHLLAQLALLLLLQSTLVAAQAEPSGSNWEELIAYAEQHSPELGMRRSAAEAAQARRDYAGALDDPMLQVEFMGIDNGNPQFLPSRVERTKYKFSQSLPWWGKRGLERSAASFAARAAGEDIELSRCELRGMLREAFSRLHVLDRSIALDREQLALLQQLEQVADTRYRQGVAALQDVIRAQTEQTRISTGLLALERDRERARFELNRLLGRAADAPLGAPSDLPPGPSGDLDSRALLAELEAASPQLRMRDAQLSASRARQQRVRKDRYPDVRLGVAPVQMGNRLDSWELMLELNLPLRSARRNAMEREADAMLRESDLHQQADRLALAQRLGTAVAEFNSARSQYDLIYNTLLPQSELALSTALAGYESAQLDFDTLIEAERQIRGARIEALMRQLDQQSALGIIESTLGRTP